MRSQSRPSNDLHHRRASAEFHHASLPLKQMNAQSSPSPSPSSAPAVWDCGSALYDSHELSTFTQHLQRAIAAEESSLPSASILKGERARSLSMPHFAFTSTSQFYKKTVVKEDEAIADVQSFSPFSKMEPLQRKTRRGVRVPKLVQRLFTRLARDGEKQNDLDAKVDRTPMERNLHRAVYYC